MKKRRNIVASLSRSTKKHSLLTLFPDYAPNGYKERQTKRQLQYLGELGEAFQRRGLVLYLGAGVSQSIGLPSWEDLIHSLGMSLMTKWVDSAVRALEGLSEQERFDQLIQLRDNLDVRPQSTRSHSVMARIIRSGLKDDFPFRLARCLYGRHRFLLERFFATPAYQSRLLRLRSRHRGIRGNFLRPKRWSHLRHVRGALLPASDLIDAIVNLVRFERDTTGVHAIVNYNFDDLLDEKLREQNIRCTTVLSGNDRVPLGAVPIYHVHGLVPVRKYVNKKAEISGNFVFGEDEYHAESADPYRWSNMTQIGHLGKHVGLFVGLSMTDPNIRRLIDLTHRQFPDVNHYALIRRRALIRGGGGQEARVLRNLYEDLEAKAFEGMGIRVLWVDQEKDTARMLRAVSARH